VQTLSVTVALVGASFAGSGGALMLRGRSRLSAVLLMLGGIALVVAGVLEAADHERPAALAAVGGAAGLLPLALATYPVPRWRHPVDFVALVVIGGCGAVSVIWPSEGVVPIMGLVQACAFLAHAWWRIEVSRDAERRALVWMCLALGASSLVYAFVNFSADGARSTLIPHATLAVFVLVGPAMYVGATLPELVDVRGLVVSSVVFAVALIGYMGLFVMLLGLLDWVGAGELNVGALALVGALCAVTFHPLQVVLRGVVDELLFGIRPDPLGAASVVAGRIGEDPVLALRAIREALVLPFAALVVDGVPVATSGTEVTHTRRLQLDGAGELVVGLRPGDLAFSEGDEQVLRLTVPLLAQTLRARAMAAELLESRGHTIAAVEEERRRLRRELHDGLGPRLSGVAFTSDAARNLIRSNPEEAERLVGQLRADTVVAIEEIRRLVYAMRPPALDELGLVPALRQQAVGLRNRSGEPVAVEVSAPEDLPDLPAAVEVAAYRIVTEALTNVARHSSGPSAQVRLDATKDALSVEVTDTGRGGDWRPGVGLASMRERAAELGGSLEAGPSARGGRVAALLPL
jgi:two-component system NarL family sensor kinase